MAIELSPLMDLTRVTNVLFYLMMAPLVVYSLRLYIFSFLGPIFTRTSRIYPDVQEKELPRVSVHIPVYNDPIVKRCIEHCLRFDYPKDKYEILVADDSNDETAQVLDEYKGNPMVSVVRRDHRKGFKAGALNSLLGKTKGDIVVVFDADYAPGKNFLKKIVAPFTDRKIAYVQSKWEYLNYSHSILTRIVGMVFNSFHRCVLPVENRIGTAIFCGTGGAIRKSVIEEVGGWNEKSLTEDMDISVRILKRGYKQAYLPYLAAPGEVPSSLRAFLKQQQRWAYGNTVASMEYLSSIAKSKKLTFLQKLDLSMLLPGFIMFPFVLGMFISSTVYSNPFFGSAAVVIPTTLAEFGSLSEQLLAGMFSMRTLVGFMVIAGFFMTVIMGLAKDRLLKDIVYMPLILLLGMVLQVTNTISVFRAILGIPLSFYKTPKSRA